MAFVWAEHFFFCGFPCPSDHMDMCAVGLREAEHTLHQHPTGSIAKKALTATSD